MATFAKDYLAKQGWKSGKGLGKAENGIVEPIKAFKKFDKTGVGHDIAKEFTNNWWERGFQNAADSIIINKKKKKVKKSKHKKDLKNANQDNGNKDSLKLTYGAFCKSTSVLENGKLITVDENNQNSTTEDSRSEAKLSTKVPVLTDEELFLACGGRTAHKGARHGITMTAKLDRIQKQDAKHKKKKLKRKFTDNKLHGDSKKLNIENKQNKES